MEWYFTSLPSPTLPLLQYHGNSTATLSISPYSRYAPIEKPDGVERLKQPDAYRLGLPSAEVTARALDEYATKLRSGASPPAAYIVETIQSCGGQVLLPASRYCLILSSCCYHVTAAVRSSSLTATSRA